MATFDRVLVIETSGRVGQVALGTGASIVVEARLESARRRASDLARVVREMLGAQGWSARDLTAIVVGLGPGSYTGLRVGLASAKALAYATGATFLGIETFAAIVARATGDQVSVASDALQGKLFRRTYQRTLIGGWEPAGELGIVPGDDWLSELRTGMAVSGPAAELFAERLPSGVTMLPDRDPRAVELLRVASEWPWAVNADVWTAEPLYLRGSSAEEKAKVVGAMSVAR